MLRVDVPFPGAAIVALENWVATPIGPPLTERATAALKPAAPSAVTVTEPVVPCCRESDTGAAWRVKVG